ncbi:MAG TPA: hypothetical protein PKD54_01720 [Pirellulaceae bacterium]|nr:hypothetical protein [Pirellulaceae bacterium]
MKTIIRSYRAFTLGVMAWGLFAFSATLGEAQQPVHPTHDGKVVSVTGNQLVMTGEDGKEHSHKLAADAKLTLDGKSCLLADLKPGTRIRVTTQGADSTAAIRIEAIDKNMAFASHIHDGTFVSLTGDKLEMTNDEGKEQSLTVTAGSKMTLDGQTCQASELKKGTKIRVFTQDPFSSTATRIEAIEKNLAFASDRHEGKLVSVIGDKLMFTGSDGKEHTLSLTTNAQLTLDGKVCKVAELKPGTRIRVTTRDAYSTVATRLEAIDRNVAFASDFHDGTIVSITTNKLVMTETNGQGEHSCTLSPDVRITLDGRIVTTLELKPGMRIRVTPLVGDSQVAIRIEALDKNRGFATSL